MVILVHCWHYLQKDRPGDDPDTSGPGLGLGGDEAALDSGPQDRPHPVVCRVRHHPRPRPLLHGPPLDVVHTTWVSWSQIIPPIAMRHEKWTSLFNIQSSGSPPMLSGNVLLKQKKKVGLGPLAKESCSTARPPVSLYIYQIWGKIFLASPR